MLAKTFLPVILLISAMPALAEDAAKYPLRVQLLKNHLACDMVATEIRKPLGTDSAAPTRAEVRTQGLAVIEGKDYNVVCEVDACLDSGQYNGKWEKQEGKLSLVAPDLLKPARLVRVGCKTSPYKGTEHFDHSAVLPPGHMLPPSPQMPKPEPAPPPILR